MKNSVHIRSIVFGLLFLLVICFSYVSFSKVFAAGPTAIDGRAISLNTGNYIFFTSEVYGANVVISDPDPGNSNMRTISGYAWSQDLGWIKFTSGETAGVFVDYSTGGVSGSAYVINTEGILDFTNFGSNVIVNPTTGVFSGYVWSSDIGWVDFGMNEVYVRDTLPPNNVTSVVGYASDLQTKEITSSDILVYNHTSPYFEWETPVDPSTETHEYVSSGIYGYYVYWGPSSTALPSSSGTFQEENSISVSVPEEQVYYLRIQAVDNHGNIYTNIDEDYTFFEYHTDLTNPTNVKYITTPSGTFGNINEMFFNWPSDAGVTSFDENGVLGWQYSINDINSWTGTTESTRFGIEYIPFSDVTYSHYLTDDKDGVKIIVGNNIIYFRTVDNAGNFSNYVTGGISFGGLSPTFPAESVVSITPSTNTSNQFALSWPNAISADERNIEGYYYMVNTTPPTTYETLTSNSSIYIPSNVTTISTTMLRGAVKGQNTVYVVAVDNQQGYSQSNAISGVFTLDSTLPDPVQNLFLSDSSIKSVQLWRASLNWEEPTYKGDGNLTYTIQRSTNGIIWSTIGTTQGLSYTDTLPTSALYYYQVGASDSTDVSQSNPTYSSIVSSVIQGRYTEPAEVVSGAVLTSISTRHATISWTTNRESDTKVAYGTSSNTYFKEEAYNSEQTTNHSIKLNNLEPDTIYYFKAKWTDEDGNTGTTNEISFKTDPMPKVFFSKIERVGLDYAIVSFEVYGATKASVLYGKNLSYTDLKEVNTSTSRSKYSVVINELQDGTTYNYKIRLTDLEGYIYDSIENHVFKTPPKPQVSNARVQELIGVASPTVMFSWDSNTEVNSIVRYRPSDSNKEMDKVDMEYILGLHEMEISGLQPETEYIAYIEGIDQLGNKAVSEQIRFTTKTDTRPPKIFNVKVEEDLISRAVQTDKSRSAQLILTWETDEPATSRVEFGEGSMGVYSSSSKIDQELRTKHLVILSGLTPSKVYSLQIVSADKVENTSKYGPLVSVTQKSNNTVLETVFTTIADIFKIF
jgi:hypothetical protein